MLDVNSASLRHLLHLHAEAGRTGALHVGGSPGGVLYLVAGHITYAESAACPGVGERLVASGRVSAEVWKRAYAEGAAERRVGRTLIRDGHLGQHELAGRVVAAIGDATHAILRGDNAAVWFAEGERHWLGVITSVAPGALPRAGRSHPGWPRRTLGRPDYASLKRIRASVKQPS